MATYNKFNACVEHLAEGVHNFASHTLKAYLAAAATSPSASADSVKADIAEISGGNGYTGGGHTLANVTSAQTSGTYKLTADDITITASGGSVGPFRYVIIYNDTPTSPADPLIAYFDYGSEITLADGESLTIDFNASNGVLQIA